MKTVSIYDKTFEPLYKRWSATLPQGFEEVSFTYTPAFKERGFQTKSWYECIDFQYTTFLNVLNGISSGELAVLSDIDILFLKQDDSLYKLIKTSFDTNSCLDILIMEEQYYKVPNTGFYCVRNSDKVRTFLTEANEYCKLRENLSDQTFFQNFMKQRLNFNFIDSKYVIFGEKIWNEQYSLIHHAVCTKGLEEKIKQQDKILNYFNMNI